MTPISLILDNNDAIEEISKKIIVIIFVVCVFTVKFKQHSKANINKTIRNNDKSAQ